jgi:hypothetical protein
MTKVLVSPAGQKQIVLDRVFLWSLLFGPFYFAYVGVWETALISGVLAVLSGGLSVLAYPFFAEYMVIEYYRKKGWTVKGEEVQNQWIRVK